jgi:5-(carboxyamino)imidazole ribonucleotide synthase
MVSQFANHWRAALRWPLGSTEMAPAFVMRNVIGPEGIQLPAARCPVPEPSTGAATYWYGKSARPGRKLGHLDAVAYSATSIAELAQRLEAVEAAWLRAVTEAAVQ